MQDRFKFRVYFKGSEYAKAGYVDLTRSDVIFSLRADGRIIRTVVYECQQEKHKGEPCDMSFTQNNNLYDIQFCTGLKDKNGELIYDGDIVKAYNPYEEHIGVIQYHTCYFSLDYKKVGKFEECGMSLTKNTSDFVKLEILGNIYENPELLDEDSETCKKRLPKYPLRRVKCFSGSFIYPRI